jgi:hypothetical protein
MLRQAMISTCLTTDSLINQTASRSRPQSPLDSMPQSCIPAENLQLCDPQATRAFPARYREKRG